MIGARAIVKRFMQSGILSNEYVEELKHVIRDPNVKEQNGTLLNFVLKPECPPVLRCIMEKEILQHCKPGDRMLTLLRAGMVYLKYLSFLSLINVLVKLY